METSRGHPADSPFSLPAALASHRFHSRDLDEVRSHIGRMFCEHDMRIIDRGAMLDALSRRFDCRGLTFTEVSYGADVLVNPGQLAGFYLIQVPLAGRAWVDVGGQQVPCTPGHATIQDPETPVEMFWSADCRKIVLRYDRPSFERFVELYAGHPVSGPVQLARRIDLARPEGSALLGLLRNVAGLPVASASEISPLLKAHLESCFMSAMLQFQPAERLALHARHDRLEPPHAVQKVRDYLYAHAHEAIAIGDLSEIAGVPLRTLHHQFRRSLGVTPMQLLRDIRLERVRAALMGAAPETSVTRVALDWGFDHLGRFAATYRNRFGETPRETLLRARGP